MKSKYIVAALLISILFSVIIPANTSFAFVQTNETYRSLKLRANMDSSYENDSFHIPPHSDDSTNLIYYYPLNRHDDFGYQRGNMWIHFTDIPYLELNQTSGSLISFVYTYDMDLVINGKSYPISGNNKYDGYGETIYPYWQSSAVDDWNGQPYIKFTVRLTYTNMDSESVLAKFNWVVPEFTTTIYPTVYYNPITYLKSISENISNGFDALKEKLDTINSTITNKMNTLTTSITDKFSDLYNQMESEHEEVINGFDSSTGDTADSDFNAGADELHNVENSLFQSASYDEVDYSQYNDFFSLTGVAGAMSFVASFFESLYAALGIYAVPFTIGLVLIIITRILGYQNFSAGGG